MMKLIDDPLAEKNFASATKPMTTERIERACQQACESIAPAWPLDQSIAVNPHWKRLHMPVRKVAARMAVLANIQVFPSREYLRNAWQAGRITATDLTQAMQQLGQQDSVEQQSVETYVHQLSQPLQFSSLPLLIDVLDDDAQRYQRLTWRDAITHQVSQTCAAYFDRDQSDWQPNRSESLYAFWRDMIVHDHGIATLMGLPHIHRYLDYLPNTRQQAERWVVEALALDESVLADYFEAVLLTVNGWASWCAYLDWQAKLNGEQDDSLRDLLAIRLAWGVILMQCKGMTASHSAIQVIQQKWKNAAGHMVAVEKTLVLDELWQRALECGYQRQLAQQLKQTGTANNAAKNQLIQAAFCIDVRSEPLRHAIESVAPDIQTLGVAGFFGLPVAYQPLASQLKQPQLPGLLAPSQLLTDRVLLKQSPQDALQDVTAQVDTKRQQQFMLNNQFERLTKFPSAAFSLVESAWPLFLQPLLSLIKPNQAVREGIEKSALPHKYKAVTRPQLQNASAEEKAALCAPLLRGLGLNDYFAPLVILVGHGSQSKNNAHASGLDCGACCGQSGEANTRALAFMLNEAEVRTHLQQHGIFIPEQTTFMAAIHNTTTQEIQGFDLDLLNPVSQSHWETASQHFQTAGDWLRKAQLPQNTNLTPQTNLMDAKSIFSAYRKRANDAAQTRPEWGLANNAAFIMAPRARTQHLNLAGRAFLHEYHCDHDDDGAQLEQLMTAPMLVTHWINWQYHASTCEPERLGSGNKLLHNVVGGRIGVFEGNGGDLRIGLSRQSLHNGQQWMHEPLRLTVFIAASRQQIQRVIDKHEVVRKLVNNHWLHLWCEEQENLWQYQHQQWVPISQ